MPAAKPRHPINALATPRRSSACVAVHNMLPRPTQLESLDRVRTSPENAVFLRPRLPGRHRVGGNLNQPRSAEPGRCEGPPEACDGAELHRSARRRSSRQGALRTRREGSSPLGFHRRAALAGRQKERRQAGQVTRSVKTTGKHVASRLPLIKRDARSVDGLASLKQPTQRRQKWLATHLPRLSFARIVGARVSRSTNPDGESANRSPRGDGRPSHR